MDLVQRLSKGKQDAKARRERNKYKPLYFRFQAICSSDGTEEDSTEKISDDSTNDSSIERLSNETFEPDKNSNNYCAKIDLQNLKIKKKVFCLIYFTILTKEMAKLLAKLYSYNLFCKSPSAYAYLRNVFPFPSESILQ